MPPDWYRRRPRCRVCGKFDTLRLDKWMNERDNRALKCECDGYLTPHFPHRRGSKYCHFRKDGTRREFGDPDWADQQYDWMVDHGINPNEAEPEAEPDDEVPF